MNIQWLYISSDLKFTAAKLPHGRKSGRICPQCDVRNGEAVSGIKIESKLQIDEVWSIIGASESDGSNQGNRCTSMKSCHKPPRADGVRRVSIRLALCLSPIVAIPASSYAPESGLALFSRPYLATIGTPSLRFAEALPPLDLSVRPPGGAPPKSIPCADETNISKINPRADNAAPIATPAVATLATNNKPSDKPNTPKLLPILPDDTRIKVKPEDFLPFFHFPTNNANLGDVTVPATATPPTPGVQPVSSATYRQQ